MTKYVVSRRIDGHQGFLCASPAETGLKVRDLYWKIVSAPLSDKEPLAVFSTVLEALRVSTWAPTSAPHPSAVLGPLSITPIEDHVLVKPATAARVSGVSAPTFDQWSAAVRVYTALQVLTSEVTKKNQGVNRDIPGGDLFDWVLIAYCEGALNRFHTALRGHQI
jgi:hypothetical protein